MKTYTKEQLSRLFGRLHETNACARHGSGAMAVCPKCDVVACRSCAGGGDCKCDVTGELTIRDHLGKLLSCFAIPAAADKHYLAQTKPAEECEMIYLEALSAMTRRD